MRNKDLKGMYRSYLIRFYQTGEHPHPSKLLALILLPEKDNYKPLKVCECEFYQYYKSEIDEKIEKVIHDFKINKEEIIRYIEETVCYKEEQYEFQKIWFVFCEGFGAMHWGIIYRPSESPEQIYKEYSGYFGKNLEKPLTRKKKKKLKKQNQ